MASLTKGLSIKGKAKATPLPVTPGVQTEKRPRKARVRRSQAKTKSNPSELVDLTGGDEDDGFIAFDGGDDLDTSGMKQRDMPNPNQAEAGPSRLSSPQYTPSSFTPLPRSLISGLARRPSVTPTPQDSPRKRSKSPDRGLPPAPASDPAPGVDIVIDEIPRMIPPPGQASVSASELGAKNSTKDQDHSEPPGLFSTTMMPSLDPSGSKVELARPSPGGMKAKETLLLPSHVELDTPPSPSRMKDDNGGNVEEAGDNSMEGLHFFDDERAQGVTRYFDGSEDVAQTEEGAFLATADQSRICQNCHRPGHKSRACTHIICTTCGAEDQHERRDCPTALVCFSCGQRGHRQVDCTNPSSRSSRRSGCDRCGARDHMEGNCPSLWRIYAYRSHSDLEATQTQKSQAAGWAKEAIGGDPDEEWCYNCARSGHLGDDCDERRGSLARLYTASGFSYAMASRGPFANSGSKIRAINGSGEHMRFEDDTNLPHLPKPFEGLLAGQKGREKQNQKRREMDRARDDEDENENGFDFSARRGGSTSRGGRGQGRYTPTQPRRDRERDRRPWDSDHRNRNRSRSPDRGRDRRNMPFSHSHLIPSSAPAKGKAISFGRLSLPNDTNSDSPSANRGKKSMNPVVSRALGLDTPQKNKASRNRPSSSPVPNPGTGTGNGKKRRRGREGEGKDWESEWRRAGNGGGKVSEWGREMDREERKGGGSPTVRGGGRVSGQRYTGVY